MEEPCSPKRRFWPIAQQERAKAPLTLSSTEVVEVLRTSGELGYYLLSRDVLKLCESRKAFRGFQSTGIARVESVWSPAFASALSSRRLSGVQVLEIRNIDVTTEDMCALQSALQGLPRLHTLVMRGRCYRAEGSKGLTAALRGHTNTLHTLHLHYADSDHSGIGDLRSAVGSLKALRVLSLNFSCITVSRRGELTEMLTMLPVLRCVKMRFGTYGFASHDAADALKGMRSLDTLDLAGNYIRFDGAKALSERLLHVPTLRKLDLSNNTLGVQGARVLAAGLRAGAPSLTHLDLSRNTLGSEGLRALLTELGHIHAHTLHTLNLSENNLKAAGARVLADGLSRVSCVHTLLLSHNHMDVDGMRALASALKKVAQLRELDLAFNEIADEGVGLLVSALQHTPTLETLNLAVNGITCAGAQTLAGGLSVTPALTSLNVAYNSIGSKGAMAIGAWLLKCAPHSRVRVLDMQGCGIGTEGVEAIAHAMTHTHTLRTCVLRQNHIGVCGVRVLLGVMETHAHLRGLEVGGGVVGCGGVRRLMVALAVKPPMLSCESQAPDFNSQMLARALKEAEGKSVVESPPPLL